MREGSGRQRLVGALAASTIALVTAGVGVLTGPSPVLADVQPEPAPSSIASTGASGSPSQSAFASASAAASAGASAAPSASGSATASPTPSGPPALTPQQAAELAAEVRAGTASLAQANDQLDTLRTQAKVALAAHADAQQQVVQAQLRAQSAQAEAEALAAQAAEARIGLDRMAADAYRGGPLAGRDPGLGALLTTKDPADLVRTVHDARVVAAEQASTVSELNAELAAKERAVRKAAAAAQAAGAAEKAEQTVAQRSADLLTAARKLVDTLATDLAGKGSADQLAQALSVAEQRQRAAELERAGALAAGQPVLGTGGCNGKDISAYPNGRIPLDALCPLWGAPGQLLRADASKAFDAMSRAFAQQFGEPLCVTDSYRSLTIQQDLIKRKPTLAAIPGTSNHGWAKAVDMCGGVESFGTRQHVWLDQNAFRFGWFHPVWAEPSGSRPEPWHWEYGGV